MQSSELAELSAIVLSSARHVLPSCGLAIGEPAESDGPPEPRQVVAFMGFTGDALRGTMAIVAPFETIRHSYPLLLRHTANWEFEVFDWAGEIANRLLARIKLGLTARGVEIEASTPRVMQGEHLHVTRSTRGTVCSACFPLEASWVRVWFDALSPEEQPLFSSRARTTISSPPEGDVVLF